MAQGWPGRQASSLSFTFSVLLKTKNKLYEILRRAKKLFKNSGPTEGGQGLGEPSRNESLFPLLGRIQLCPQLAFMVLASEKEANWVRL